MEFSALALRYFQLSILPLRLDRRIFSRLSLKFRHDAISPKTMRARTLTLIFVSARPQDSPLALYGLHTTICSQDLWLSSVIPAQENHLRYRALFRRRCWRSKVLMKSRIFLSWTSTVSTEKRFHKTRRSPKEILIVFISMARNL